MPGLSSLDTRTLFPQPLSNNPVIKDPDDCKLFEASMQGFIDLIREKKIKEDSLKKLKEQLKDDAKARRYPNLVEKQATLNQQLDKNQRRLEKQIQTVLDNDSLLTEWRKLPQKSFELIDKQTQLAEDLTEEIINEEQAQKFKSLINAEFDIFYSEPVCELYKRDFQAILDVGISESVVSYLKALSQLDEVMHLEVKKEIDRYQNEQENLRANQWIESAEQWMAKQAQVSNQRIDFRSITDQRVSDENESTEDKPLPALYTANSAEAVYELLLNGADPVQESKNLDSTPLTQHFASRYIIEQELNRVEHIEIPHLKNQLDSKFAENQLTEKFLEQKKQLKIDLNNQIETLIVEVELQPEFKIEIESQIQELKQETKALKRNLKTDLENQNKELKKKNKALTPKLKIELTNQLEQLKTEADGLTHELKNNAALIDAHIKAIVLRNADAQIFDYPDVAHKKRFYETWNHCKQEIKELQHTTLAENCSAYHFLTEDLAQLPSVAAKNLKSTMLQFPEYKPLLQKQAEILDNYRLVQGPRPVTPTTKGKLASASKHSLKESVSESKSETPVLPTIETTDANAQSQRSCPKKSYSRLNYSAFFEGSLQSKSESVSKKTSERTSRLNGSLFFAMAKAPSDLNEAKQKSIDRTICYAK